MMRTFDLLVAAFALLQIARYGRGALLALLPWVRVRVERGTTPRSAAMIRAGAELEGLGFVPLGALHERGALGAFARGADVYASAGRGAFADLVHAESRDGTPVEFYTPFADGAAVLTANDRRRGVVSRRWQLGGLPGVPLQAVLAAHEKAVTRFASTHGPPAVHQDLESRLAAARAWHRGAGRRELRRAGLVPLLITLVAAALFASSASMLLRAAGPR